MTFLMCLSICDFVLGLVFLLIFRDCKNDKGLYMALELQNRFDLDTLLDTTVSALCYNIDFKLIKSFQVFLLCISVYINIYT